MAKNDVFQRLLDSGISFTAMSQARAEAIVKDLVKQGSLRRKETETMVATLMDRGREGAERIAQMVEEEVGRQVARIAAQLDELETRLTSMTGGSSTPKPATVVETTVADAPVAAKAAKRAPRKAATPDAPAPAAPAKKATTRKTTAKAVAAPAAAKAPAKQATAKKAAAKQATAPKVAAPRRTAAKKAAAKQASA